MFDVMRKGMESSISLGFTPNFEVIFHVIWFFNTNENVTENKFLQKFGDFLGKRLWWSFLVKLYAYSVQTVTLL